MTTSALSRRSRPGKHEEDQALLKPSNLCGIQHSGSVQSTHVPVPLRVHEAKVWLQREVVVYRHDIYQNMLQDIDLFDARNARETIHCTA